VLAGEAPGGFTMAGEIDGWQDCVGRIQAIFNLYGLELHESEFEGNPSWQISLCDRLADESRDCF
jgi:hypothetical protein